MLAPVHTRPEDEPAERPAERQQQSVEEHQPTVRGLCANPALSSSPPVSEGGAWRRPRTAGSVVTADNDADIGAVDLGERLTGAADRRHRGTVAVSDCRARSNSE